MHNCFMDFLGFLWEGDSRLIRCTLVFSSFASFKKLFDKCCQDIHVCSIFLSAYKLVDFFLWTQKCNADLDDMHVPKISLSNNMGEGNWKGGRHAGICVRGQDEFKRRSVVKAQALQPGPRPGRSAHHASGRQITGLEDIHPRWISNSTNLRHL